VQTFNFQEEILGTPLPREVDFYIDLASRVAPISKAVYRIAFLKLRELKIQLDELLEEGYIRPNTSP